MSYPEPRWSGDGGASAVLRRAGGPGDFLHVPPGGLHAFRGTGSPASMLVLFTLRAPR